MGERRMIKRKWINSEKSILGGRELRKDNFSLLYKKVV